ncbi:MAG: hypothetical protein QW251_05895, partial [Desulfurococcaceae archaeon]
MEIIFLPKKINVMQEKNRIYCSKCLLINEQILEPVFINNNKENTFCVITDIINDNDLKQNTVYHGLLKQIVDNIQNYNVLIIPPVLCYVDPSKSKNLLKIIRACIPNIYTYIQKYKPKKYLILGRNALNMFERLTNIKVPKGNLDQLDQLGILKERDVEYRITYHIGVYTKTKQIELLNSILRAFEDITGEKIEITLESNIKQLNEIRNNLQVTVKERVNLKIDANNYDLILVTKLSKNSNIATYTFYRDGQKNVLNIEMPVIVYNDSLIKQLNYLHIIDNIKLEQLQFTNDINYLKNLKRLNDFGINFSLYVLDTTKLINHIAFVSSVLENVSYNIYQPTYLDIELVNDKIVLATVIHENKVYLFTDKKVDFKTIADEIIVTNDIATELNNFLVKNSVIITGWNVYFDIYHILTKAKLYNFDKKNLQVSYDEDNNYCNYPYYAILDLMYLYKRLINPNSLKYSLDYVAYNELGKRKILTAETFEDLYKNNFEKFVEYNILDTILVKELDEKHDIINLAQQIRIAIQSPIDQDIITKHSKIGTLILIRELL